MDKDILLDQIEKNVKVCTKCRLYKTAKNAVPGEGNRNTKIVFVGEAPGATEDATGKPFVGRAGKLLDQLLKEIGYERKDIWIGNIIKHRPLENRDPLPDEIEACTPYLTAQLDAIKPEVIITLGRFAMNYFYKDGKISRDHGRPVRAGKWLIYPLYHPAAALRSSGVAAELRKDFARIPEILEKIDEIKARKSDIIKDTGNDNGQLNYFRNDKFFEQ